MTEHDDLKYYHSVVEQDFKQVQNGSTQAFFTFELESELFLLFGGNIGFEISR